MEMLHVEVPIDLTVELQAKSLATGRPPGEIAVAAIRRGLHSDDAERKYREEQHLLADSGLSEDEAVELFESEKHALRSERREAAT
jgi:hypothetical protein